MKTVLQLSGGKDSLACLYLLEPFWEGMTVVWADPGDASLPLRQFMNTIAGAVPHFATVKGYAIRHRREHGDPDVTTWPKCCAANMWSPMMDYLKENNIQYVVRGAKKSDRLSLIQPGLDTETGLGFIMPVWDWDDDRVRAFLKDKPVQPVYPHDCATCPTERPCAAQSLENAA